MTKGNLKKNEQLGMNYSTASGRLVKDILWSMIEKSGQNRCYHCGGEMTRGTYSIEHKIPWLDSENPTDLFFDLDNISFSHLSCNISAASKPHKKYHSQRERQDAINKQQREKWASMSTEDRKQHRVDRYKKYNV